MPGTFERASARVIVGEGLEGLMVALDPIDATRLDARGAAARLEVHVRLRAMERAL